MKYKKELGGLLIFLTFAWPVFDILDPSYTPTQVILTVIFAYLGMRLTYFVYSKISSNWSYWLVNFLELK